MRSKLLFAVLLAFFLLGIFAGIHKLTAPKLAYKGQSIDYWFTKLPVTIHRWGVSGFVVSFEGAQVNALGLQYGSTNDADEALTAFDYFGTNAIPFLLDALSADDSQLEEHARQLARKYGSTSFPFRDATFQRGQAVSGLVGMRELPAEAMNELYGLATNSPPEIAASAGYILRARVVQESDGESPNNPIDENGEPALPIRQ